MEVRYVEEDDKEGEEGSGEADEDDEAELGEVGQGGETEPSAPRREHARQAGHGGQLRSIFNYAASISMKIFLTNTKTRSRVLGVLRTEISQ